MNSVRDWRQRLDPQANLVWRKRVNWSGVVQNIGDPIPEELRTWTNKLRSLWNAGHIEIGAGRRKKRKLTPSA